MSAPSSGDIQALTDVITFIMSLGVSVFLSGMRRGSTDRRLIEIEKKQDQMATRDQIVDLKERIAEIKGMFRMIPKDEK